MFCLHWFLQSSYDLTLKVPTIMFQERSSRGTAFGSVMIDGPMSERLISLNMIRDSLVFLYPLSQCFQSLESSDSMSLVLSGSGYYSIQSVSLKSSSNLRLRKLGFPSFCMVLSMSFMSSIFSSVLQRPFLLLPVCFPPSSLHLSLQFSGVLPRQLEMVFHSFPICSTLSINCYSSEIFHLP